MSAEKTEKLLAYLNDSPTPFHAAANTASVLKEAGFIQLNESEHWQLKSNGRYFVQRNQSSIVAFRMPEQLEKTLQARIVASHLDSPALRLKLRGRRKRCNLHIIPTEVYGGAITATWLDRPLGIAGRIVEYTEKGISARLYNQPNAAIIPNLALQHLGSDMKNGISYNPQTQLSACLGTSSLFKAEELLHLDSSAFEDSELSLYDCTPAQLLGENGDLLNAPRLDNMLAAFSSLEAIIEAAPRKTGLLLSFFADNEEIGSSTRQGARSNFLQSVLTRIILALGGNEEDFLRMLASSFLVSNDAAHAQHPSYMEAYDNDYAPEMGKGVVLKKNVQHRYASNGEDIAFFRKICTDAAIPVQVFTNRADRPCGSTVGPALTTQLGMHGLDIGIAMFAMHSIRETASLQDVWSCVNAMLQFFSSTESISFAEEFDVN